MTKTETVRDIEAEIETAVVESALAAKHDDDYVERLVQTVRQVHAVVRLVAISRKESMASGAYDETIAGIKREAAEWCKANGYDPVEFFSHLPNPEKETT